MTETAPETHPAAAAPAPAVETGVASRVAALEADVSTFAARVRTLEAKTESWLVKHAAILAAVGGFLAGVAFTLVARHLHL